MKLAAMQTSPDPSQKIEPMALARTTAAFAGLPALASVGATKK